MPWNQTYTRTDRRDIVQVAILVIAVCASCSPAAPAGSTRASEATRAEPAESELSAEARLFSRDQERMGTRFQIQVVAADAQKAAMAIDAAFQEVARVEALISSWRETSEISEVNRLAGGPPVEVGPELLSVVQRAKELSELTDGAFDISFAGCGHLWSFRDARVPSDDQIEACLPRVDYEGIRVDLARSTIQLTRAQMQIGVGGIGKGYGVDRASDVLEAHGIDNYVVDGGGDIRARGTRKGRPWIVGIAHPRQRGQLLGSVEITDGAVVSSGDYERFFEQDGTYYHHILDPDTGRPARRSMAVTVIARDATDADALSTGLFVLGPTRGLALVEQLEHVEALIVGTDLELHMSSNFEARFEANNTSTEAR